MLASSVLASKATYPKTIIFTNTSINAKKIFDDYSGKVRHDSGYRISLVDF